MLKNNIFNALLAVQSDNILKTVLITVQIKITEEYIQNYILICSNACFRMQVKLETNCFIWNYYIINDRNFLNGQVGMEHLSLEHLSIEGHRTFEDVTIRLIDETDRKDPKQRKCQVKVGKHQQRIAQLGLSVEDGEIIFPIFTKISMLYAFFDNLASDNQITT